MHNYKHILYVFISTLTGFFISSSALAEATGNRYNLPRDYHSEISSRRNLCLNQRRT